MKHSASSIIIISALFSSCTMSYKPVADDDFKMSVDDVTKSGTLNSTYSVCHGATDFDDAKHTGRVYEYTFSVSNSDELRYGVVVSCERINCTLTGEYSVSIISELSSEEQQLSMSYIPGAYYFTIDSLSHSKNFIIKFVYKKGVNDSVHIFYEKELDKNGSVYHSVAFPAKSLGRHIDSIVCYK